MPPSGPAVAGQIRCSNRELDTYMTCPKQYFFDVVLGLRGRRLISDYLVFHRCVYQVLAWMSSEQSAGRSVDHGSAAIKLDEVWVASAAKDHAYRYYRREAERLIKDAVDRIRSSSGRPLDLDWEIPLSNGIVTVRPDHITVIEAPGRNSVSIQRWRTGKPPKKPKSDEIYVLYARGAELAYPRAEATIETLYLSTNEVQTIPMTAKQIASGWKSMTWR